MNVDNKKEALHCIQYLPHIRLEDGGVIRYVLDLCMLLHRQGVRVTLVTQDGRDVPAAWFSEGDCPSVIVLKGKQLPAGILSEKALNSIKDLFGENTVINIHVPWLISNVQIANLATKHNIPYVVTPHGSLDVWSMKQKTLKKLLFWYLFAKKMFKRAKFIHYTATSEKEQAEKYIRKDGVKIIPCAFDATDYRILPDKAIAKNRYKEISSIHPNILFLSRLHPKKGADILINAIKILSKKGVRVNVLIAGPDDYSVKGYRDLLSATVNEANLQDYIHFIGMVKGNEKLSLYRNADIFVLPTHQENFGLVLIEALACNTPVLTSYEVDIWKDIQHGGAVIVNNNPDELAEKIELLLSDKNNLRSLGVKGRDWVLTELDADKVSHQYLSMYKSACLPKTA